MTSIRAATWATAARSTISPSTSWTSAIPRTPHSSPASRRRSCIPTAPGPPRWVLYPGDAEWFFRGDFGRPSVFDVRNPSNVILTYSFNDLPGAVSHIPVIHGNLAAVSYYSAGVRLFDLSVPSQPVEFGFYDTWPGDDFLLAGCYQAAALFPSGLVCAADDLTGLRHQPDLTYGIVRGLVRDAGGGMKPLGGVTVRVLPDGPSTTTAADGSYALAPPPGAAVSVAAAKYGYAQQTATVTVATASDQMVNFALSSQPTGSVKGTVQRSLTGTSLAGADVSILDAPFTAVSGSRGTYSFSKVATGPAVVRPSIRDSSRSPRR